MLSERTTLQIVSAVGYANLVALLLVIFSVKTISIAWVFYIPPAVAVFGTLLYHAFWHRVFPCISKAEGRPFIRPYIVGSAVVVAATLLVLGLQAYASNNAG